MPDGKPDLTGFYQSDAGGANYGLERHPRDFLTPGTRGVIVDPPDGKLPLQPWARAERIERELPVPRIRRSDRALFCRRRPAVDVHAVAVPDPSAAGLRRAAVRADVVAHDPARRTPHIPDNVRLWQGDSVGHWEGDTLVVETTNLNGKTWLNEVGEVVSHAETVVERFIPVNADLITYRATVTDPIVYTRPWTIEIPLRRQAEELIEIACHEDNGDLQHLKDVRDAERAKRNKEK